MAGEVTTTTSTMDDVINTSLVEPTIIPALSERPGLAFRVCRQFSAIGKPTASLKIPKQTSFWGSPNDRGAGVDTEFDGTEANAAGYTAISTDGVTINTPEYVVATSLGDRVGEDGALDAAEVLALIQGGMLTALTLALDDDLVALASGLSNNYGTSGSDLTIAQTFAAKHGIIVRGANAESIEYVLSPEQVQNVNDAIISANAASAVYAQSADRLIGYAPGTGRELGGGQVMQLHNCVVTLSGLCDTANAGADDLGMAFVPSSAWNDASGATTFGLCMKRLPRFEPDRQAKSRATDLVMSMRMGVAELQDGSGSKITTDAP